MSGGESDHTEDGESIDAYVLRPGNTQVLVRDLETHKLKHLGYIPPKLTREHDGHTFLQLRLRVSIVRHILCSGFAHQTYDQARDIVQRTDVVLQLGNDIAKAKKDKIMEGIVSNAGHERMILHQKRFRTARLTLSTTINVNTPIINDIPSIEIVALTEKSKFPWIMMTQEALKWLADATKAQYNAGGVTMRQSCRAIADARAADKAMNALNEVGGEPRIEADDAAAIDNDNEAMGDEPAADSPTGCDNSPSNVVSPLVACSAQMGESASPSSSSAHSAATLSPVQPMRASNDMTPPPRKQLKLDTFFNSPKC